MQRTVRMIATMALVLSLAGVASAQDQDHKDKHAEHQQGGGQMQPGGQPGNLPPANPNQGYFGARFGDINDEVAEELGLDSQDGVVIIEVVKDSPAEKAGLKPMDIVKKLGDKDITNVPSFVTVMRASKPGDELKVSVIREKKTEELTVTLGKRPANMEQQQQPKAKEDPATKPSDK